MLIAGVDLSALVAICAGALILYAFMFLMRSTLVELFRYIPFIGGTAYRWATNVINRAAAASRSWAVHQVARIGAIVYDPWHQLDQWIIRVEDVLDKLAHRVTSVPGEVAKYTGLTYIYHAIESMVGTLENIYQLAKAIAAAKTVTMKEVEDEAWKVGDWYSVRLQQDIYNSRHTAEHWAWEQAHGVQLRLEATQHHLTALTNQVAALGVTIDRMAKNLTRQTYTIGEEEVARAVSLSETYTRHKAGAIEAAMTGVLSREEQAAAKNLEALTASVGRTVAGIDASIGQLRDTLDSEIGTAEAEAKAYAGAIGKALTGEIEAAAAEAREAKKAAAGVQTALDDYLEKCGKPLCSMIGPSIPMMQEIEGLLEDGLLAALVIEMIENPEKTAETMAAWSKDIVDEGVKMIEDLIGVVS